MSMRNAIIVITLFLLVLLFMHPTGYAQSTNLDASFFLWGVVGHNDRPSIREYSYNIIPLKQQFTLISRSGLNSYRSGCDDDTCTKIAKNFSREKGVYLRAIELWPDVTKDENENYDLGYSYAYREAVKYKGKIHYYEASNELDNWTGMIADGAEYIQYHPQRYVKARGFIKGIIEGVHAADPTAKVLVDDAGWCHYGFLKALWADGIRWDITAFHWYSDQGNIEKAGCRNANIADIHASFGKPIWITEFNERVGSTINKPEGKSKWVLDFIDQVTRVAPKYNIQAAFIYELLDEPGMTGSEQFYGIADSSGQPKEVLKDIQKRISKF